MPRMTSDLSTLRDLPLIPRAVYTGTPHEVKPGSSKAQNPKLTTTWKVAEGEYTDRLIPFDEIVTGGWSRCQNHLNPQINIKTVEACPECKPIVLRKLAQIISALQAPWNCLNCNSGDREIPFLIGTGDDGLQKGKYYCPDCKSPMKIDYETNFWLGRKCKIGVTSEKEKDGEREFNRVASYAPLE